MREIEEQNQDKNIHVKRVDRWDISKASLSNNLGFISGMGYPHGALMRPIFSWLLGKIRTGLAVISVFLS